MYLMWKKGIKAHVTHKTLLPQTQADYFAVFILS